MIDLMQARLTTLAVHKVGNKVRNEGVIASKELFKLEEDIQLILQDYSQLQLVKTSQMMLKILQMEFLVLWKDF